jgi:hypothetical protein
MGKHFIDPKSSEFCPFFKFEILEETLVNPPNSPVLE